MDDKSIEDEARRQADMQVIDKAAFYAGFLAGALWTNDCEHPGCCCVCNHQGRCPECGPSHIEGMDDKLKERLIKISDYFQ